MQLKLYKRSTILLSLTMVIDALLLVFLLKYRADYGKFSVGMIMGFIGIAFLLSLIFAYYDLNCDRNYIRKAVKNGDVAMAKIKDGTFVRFARDARLKNHVYWKINAELYDDDFNKIDITIIEKFSTHQTKIPTGYVYVTYIKDHLDDCLIIPNVIIQSIPEYQFLVESYEKAIKPTYLNAYYKDGLVVQTYKDSMKEQNEYYREFNKQQKELLNKKDQK